MTTVADNTIKVFDVGDQITLRFEVVDKNGTLADASATRAWVTKPGATTRTVVALTNVATGIYEGKVKAALGEDGDWWWRAEADGNGSNVEDQTGERTFNVRKQGVIA